jgi:hypothetical protein
MSENAHVDTSHHDDGSFDRTAIVVPVGGSVSFALVDEDGTRLVLINAFNYVDGNLIVDVIDKDARWNNNRALSFRNGYKVFIEAGSVISADFR